MEIPKLEWPQRSCRDAVWSTYVAHSCELLDMHHGPCASMSVASSLQRREAWEKAQQEEQEEQSV